MGKLTIHNGGDLGELRTILIDDEPWIAAKDVAKCLGYSNTGKAIRTHVSEKNKTESDDFVVHGTKGVLINEAGLYELILASRTEKAQKFKDWVTGSVLPSISRHGVYIAGQEKMTREQLLKTIDELRERVKEQSILIEQNNTAVEFAKSLIAQTGEVDTGTMAKLINQSTGKKIGRTKFLKWLRNNHYISSQNIPNQKYIEMGVLTVRTKEIKAVGRTVTIHTPMITPKGQTYFVNKFKNM